MILPGIRSSFGRTEAAFLVWLTTRDEPEEARDQAFARLAEEGFDVFLDDPRAANALLAGRDFSTAPEQLVFYVLVRQALLEGGMEDRVLADYLATLLLAFGRARRAYRPDGQEAEFHYLVDILAAATAVDTERALMLQAHLGEFALWLSGLFPDHISARVRRRGAPGLDYYQDMGMRGFRAAARSRAAAEHGMDVVYEQCAASFPGLRVALNRVADRHLFPARGDRIERLLRQVADRFDHPPDGN
ncbi:MAG: hypothetical protein WEB88_05665 [Gemmatimonadota bacterium]